MRKASKLYTLLSIFMVVSMLSPTVIHAVGPNPIPYAVQKTDKSSESLVEEEAWTALTEELGMSPNEAPSPSIPYTAPDLSGAGNYGSAFQNTTPALSTIAPAKGQILFAPSIDIDGNAATNPVMSHPVSVVELLGHQGGIVQLAVQLETYGPAETAVNIPVTFQIWNSQDEVVFEFTAQTDTWGTAQAQVPVEDAHETYSYQAWAPNFGQTEVRRFQFDTNKVSVRLHEDGATLSYTETADRWYNFTLKSPVPLDPERDVAELTIMRRSSQETLEQFKTDLQGALTDEEIEQLLAELGPTTFPTVFMEIVGEDTAQVRVQLPPGDYGVIGMVEVKDTLTEYFHSEALRFETADVPAATLDTVVWASEVDYEPGKTLVIRENEGGQVRFDLVDSAQLPTIIEQNYTPPQELINFARVGPFEWREERYDIEIDTLVDDGKKKISLHDFNYDPLHRRYTIAVESLQDEVITDTMRIDVFGPGKTVLLHEDRTVVLQPDEIFYYEIEVPAHLGEPEGIRVGLDDPILEDIRAIIDAARTIAGTADFEIKTLYVRAYADILRQVLIEIKYDFASGQFEFRTPFWDSIRLHPFRTLVEMAEAAGQDITLFRVHWLSLGWDIVTGRIFGRRDSASLFELLDKILSGLSIRLGGLTIAAGAEVTASLTADPTMHCPDPEDVQAVKDNLNQLALLLDGQVAGDRFNETTKPKWKIPIIGWVAITVGTFGARAGTEFEYQPDFTIELSGQVEISVGAGVVISPFTIVEVLRDIVSLFGGGTSAESFFNRNKDRLKYLSWFAIAKWLLQAATTIKRWNFYYNLIKNVIDQISIYGDCDPDPPDPRPPDDRQDVWQGVENFYEGATHADTINNLSQLLQQAQNLGLDRAERLLTLRLREAELSRFLDDNDAYVDYMRDTFGAYAWSDYDLLQIITGTVPLTTTEAVSAALLSRLDQRDQEIFSLPYVTEQERLENNYLVAEQEFLALRGQELELQRELRLLFTADTVGILASGFAEATQSAAAAMGLPSQLISPWPNNGQFRGQPAPYLAPGLAPRVVVVPSGGLHAISRSTEARDWLDAYVSGGGLLIAFSQAFGDDWSALPGGQLDGVGYEEDRRWQHATVEATQPSDWLVWMGIPKPDVQIDGAFTSWPPDANVLLKRTFGDYAGYPVMVEYTHGEGTVLATSAYGDWAWQTNFWWGDDARLTHSILIRGYHLARGEDVGSIFTGDPASSVDVTYPLTNTSSVSITQVTLQIPLVWGRSRGASATVPASIAPGDGAEISATIPTPPVRRGVHDWTQVGLYRVQMTVRTSDGNSYKVWGPFVYVRSPVVPPALSGSLQVEQSPVSLFGTAVLTASVQNFTAVDRVVTISDTTDLPTDTIPLNVPANGTAFHVYTLFMDSSKSPGVIFYDEAGDVIGRGNAGIRVAYPDLRATPLIPAALADGAAIPVVVTNQARQGQALAASLALTLTTPSGTPIWSETQPLPTIAAGETTTPTFTLVLPSVELGTYQLVYRVDDGRNLARTSTVPIPSQVVLDATFDRASYRIRESGVLTVVIENAGRFDLTPSVTVDAPALGLNETLALNLPVGDQQTLVYPFTVPDTLDDGTYEAVVSYQVGSQIVDHTLSLQVPQSRALATMRQTSYLAGEEAVVELLNSGGVDAPVTGTLRLFDVYGTAVATQTIAANILAGGGTTVTLTIPAGAITGDYFIELIGQNTDTGAPLNMERHVDIEGVAGALTVYTGQDDYFSDEQIENFAEILMASGSLTDSDLTLRICTANANDGFEPPAPLINYEYATVPFNWIDIASGGNIVARGSSAYTLVDIGFPFEFYGNTYTQMYVSSEGFITFGSGNSSGSNTAIPDINTPNNAIYALWDDLYPIDNDFGNIYVQQIDANRTVVQWQEVAHCCSTSNLETFQAVLDGSDSSVTLQYQDVSLTSSATVGVENSIGSDAIQIAYNEAGVIDDNLAVRLAPTLVQVPQTTYNSTAVDFEWVDIASGGTIVSQGTNQSTLVDIGFPFQFYGITYTQMYVNSNGYLTFGSSYSDSSNDPIPNVALPNNAIYGLWDYLYPIGDIYGNIYVDQVDATHTVVQWQEVTHCCGSSNPETFQIILNGEDHSFRLQYQDVSFTGSATVGVENSTGTDAIQVVYDQPGVINDGLALEFAAAAVPVPDTTYSTTAEAFNWIDIAAEGNLVAQGDNTATFVDLGFPFQFYGITYTYMYVNSNGYISFDGSYTDQNNTAVPSTTFPNNAVYAFWDDLYPTGGLYGSVYASQVGPSRYVVQWQEVAHCCSAGQTETFQIVIDGADDSITLQYLDISDASSATVGVENFSGTDGVQLSYNQTDVITDNLAIRLTTSSKIVQLTNYLTTTVPINWQDISATGTIISQGDDTFDLVEIGFPFEFYGISYNQMYVDSNGYLTFDTPSYSEYYNDYIPNGYEPNNAIYGLWTDLYPVGGIYGNVYSQQISPTMHIIQWHHVSHCCSSGITETFQIVLNGADNSITFQYLDLTESQYATIGVENAGGSVATLVYFGGFGSPEFGEGRGEGLEGFGVNGIPDNTAVQLTPFTGPVEVPTYISATTPISWIDIAPPPGVTIIQGNNIFSQVEIGFPFQFYGITYTQMFVGDNGFVSFENGYTLNGNGSLPSTSFPNNAIYAFWDYLYPIGGAYGQIFTQQISPTLHVIQWESVAHCCSTSYPETFQIILDGSDHSITLQYEDISLTSSATVGIENRPGNQAMLLSYNQTGIINDGSAFKLTPTTQYTQQPGYLMSTVPISWTNAAPEPGTEVLLGSTNYRAVNLGFPFEFYGSTYTDMYVSTEGLVTFGSANTSSSNTALPTTSTPNNAIYALWDNLYPLGGDYGQVYMRQISPTLYAVQWENVAHCCSTTYPETFQILLDGSDNSITLQYEDVSLTSSATVGVEDLYGIEATQLSYNQTGIINDGTAFELTPLVQQVTRTTYISTVVPISWTDITPEPGTLVVAAGRNVFEQVDLGFSFEFYGKEYTDLYVGSNGYVSFDAGYTINGNTSIPNFNQPDNAIYALWDYLDPIGGNNGQIYARQTGANQYVIQWEGVTHCCSGSSPETFQVILDGSDDSIVLQYEDVSLTSSATVGVEHEFGGRATQVAYNQSGVIVDNLALLFTPVEEEQPPPPICDPTQPLPLDVVLVIDRSGSMSGQKIVDAKAAAIAFVDFMDLTLDRGSLVSFASDATLDQLLTQDQAALESAINALIATGGTRIDLGLNVARSEIVTNGDPLAAPVIILLSDGVSSGDPIGAANAAKAEGIRIISIGLGSGADATTLRAIASAPEDYYFAPSSVDLQNIFESIGNSICRSPLPYDASCGGFILWEETVPVSVTTSLDVMEIAEPLEVNGRMVLDGRLYAETDQPLAKDQYPFYLHDRDTAITLETDRDIYRPGQTVEATGYVTNTSTLTVSTNLEVWASSTQLLDQPITLAPGEGIPYTVVFSGTTGLPSTNLPFFASANGVSTFKAVVVTDPKIETALLAPDVVNRDPFSVTLVLTNTGLVTAALQPTIQSQPQPGFTFDSGNVLALNGTAHTLQDGVVTATVSGDVTKLLSEPVIQGELAALTLLPPASNLAGPIEIPYQVSGTGLLPADGALTLTLNGETLGTQPFAVLAGQTLTGSIAVVLPAGKHSLAGQLSDQYGPFDDDTLDVTLLAPAEPAVPVISDIEVSVSPSPAAAGGTVEVTVEVTNDGAAAPIIIGLQLFEPEEQHIVTPPAHETTSYTFELDIPGDMPADEYFGEAVVDGQTLPFIVDVTGIDLEMSLALDQVSYYPGEIATLTVTITDVAGISGDYLVMPRYLTAEDYYTVTIPADQTIQYTFSFTATESARANVFLATTATPPNFERRVLMLDSLPVPVVQPEHGATISFDKLVYDPGDTVYITVNVTGTLNNLFVMGPLERTIDNPDVLVWNAPIDPEALLTYVLTGTYNLSTTLPASMKEGRYTFLAGINTEIRTYPIDVRGYKVTTRHFELDRSRYNQQDTITAVAEFWNEGETAIIGLELETWIIMPDNNGVLSLEPPVNRTVDLQPGLNVISVTGTFDTPYVGAHRLLMNLKVPGETWRVAGAVGQFNVGWANLVELNTNKGTYSLNEPGVGRLDVYGFGPTDLTVTLANDGSLLLDQQQVDLNGFETFSFTVPTAVQDNYLLIADSVDQTGNTDQLTYAYAVPAPIDDESPQVVFSQPLTHTILTTAAPTTTFTFTGEVSDNGGTALIIANGEVFSPTAEGDFEASVMVEQGYNTLFVTAIDDEGNFTSSPAIAIQVVPEHSVSLTVDRDEAQIGELITFQFTLSATRPISDVSALQLLPSGLVTDVTVLTPTRGVADVLFTGTDYGISWQGTITDPITITGLATAHEEGIVTSVVEANWGFGLGEESNSVTVDISDVGTGLNAVDDQATTKEGTAVTIDVLANDSGPGGPLTVAAVTQPANGTAVINPDDTVTYTPASSFAGVDTFTYTVNDDQGGADTATVTVHVIEDSWQQVCVPNNLTVDIIGTGMGSAAALGPNPASLTVSQPEDVAFILNQVVLNNYSQLQPDKVIVSSAIESHELLTPTVNNEAGYYYEVFLQASEQITAEVVGTGNGEEQTPRAFISYLFREGDGSEANTGQLVHEYVFQNSHSLNLSIPTAAFARDVVVTFAVADMDVDARVAVLEATAGSVNRSVTVVQPNYGSDLLLYEVVLPAVPGDVDTVTVTVTSPSSNGDSLYWSGVNVGVPCVVPTTTGRVTDDLQALYTFQEGSGTTVHDVSGVGTPLDLSIADETAVSWLSGGGLSVDSATVLTSAGAATKIIASAQDSNEFTVEAWVKTGSIEQDGPARMVTLAPDATANNFELGQGQWSTLDKDVFIGRVRTSSSQLQMTTPTGSVTADLTQVVFTRDSAGVIRIYVNGVEAISGTAVGDFSTWDASYLLALANAPGGTRPWLGELHLVAIYNRALTEVEVQQNLTVGNNLMSSADDLPGERLVIEQIDIQPAAFVASQRVSIKRVNLT